MRTDVVFAQPCCLRCDCANPKSSEQKFYFDLDADLSDEARYSLLSSDEATGRVSNAQVLDPALEVSLVDWTLEVAARPVKARWPAFKAAEGDIITLAAEACTPQCEVLRVNSAKFWDGERITC